MCILSSGLATDTSTTGFALDSSNANDLKLLMKIPQKMLDSFVDCRYSYVLQFFVIRIGRIVLNNLKNSEKEEDVKKFGAKTVKEIPADFLTFESKAEEYITQYLANDLKDNEQTTALIRELTLLNLKEVLNKDSFYRELLIQYEDEIISHLESINEEEFDWSLGETQENTANKNPNTTNCKII
jgi:hypothetical protein